MENSDQIMQFLTEAEEAAESVLTDKAQMIELDRTRNKVRQASRVVGKTPSDSKVWVCVGGTFVKMPSKNVVKILRHDLNELDDDVSKLRLGLKRKVEKLRDVENKESLSGFDLNPLSRDEMRSLENLL